MTMHTPNPLLASTGLPLFDQIRAEHVGPAIDQLIAHASAALETVTAPDFPADWNALATTLDTATEALGRAWGAVSHLSSVADTPELRAAFNAALPVVTEFWTRLGADERLYAKYKAVDVQTLNAEQRKAHANALRSFVLSGAELQGAAKERFAAIQERSAALAQKFSENTLDATDRWAYYATAEEMQGIPADVQQAARAAARSRGPGRLQAHAEDAVLPAGHAVCHTAARCAKSSTAPTSPAPRTRPKAMASSSTTAPIIEEILALRQEEAQLLGYANFGEVSLVPKMANSPARSSPSCATWPPRHAPTPKGTWPTCANLPREQLGLADPQPWDWTYIAEKLKEAALRLQRAGSQGIFHRAQGAGRPVQDHRNPVRRDASRATRPRSGTRRCEFYRLERDGQAGRPVLPGPARRATASAAAPGWTMCAAAGCAPDTGTAANARGAPGVQLCRRGRWPSPPLLTHDDVITLFHESGHALHHLLTQVNGARCLRHQRRGMGRGGAAQPVHGKLLLGMGRAAPHDGPCRNRRAPAARAVRQDGGGQELPELACKPCARWNLPCSTCCCTPRPPPADDYLALLQQVRDEVAVLPTTPYNRSTNTFSHIFAGGYAAGYYSYKWAEVLSADAYAAFEETHNPDGSHSRATGQKYLHEILERGGSRSALENFTAFRGRAPQLDALLRHQGMAEPVSA